MVRKFMTVALLAAVVGGAYGLITPASPVRAVTVNVGLGINPGASNTLTCGWHSACIAGQYDPRTALDWDNPDNGTVYWRSWGYRDDGYTGQIANAWLYTTNTPTCYQIRIDVWDVFGYLQGTEYYQHTTTPWNGWSNPVNAGGGYWSYTSFAIGYSPATELSGSCSFFGSHNHQYGGPSFGRNSPGYPDAPASATYADITQPGYWQNNKWWTWTY